MLKLHVKIFLVKSTISGNLNEKIEMTFFFTENNEKCILNTKRMS